MDAPIYEAILTMANPFYRPGDISKIGQCHRHVNHSHTRSYAKKLSILQSNNAFPSMEIQLDDVIELTYSSITMGCPKGIIWMHKSLMSSVTQQVYDKNLNLYFTFKD